MNVSKAKQLVSKEDFKKYALMFGMIASSIAGMTSTKKDDAAAFLINNNINNPDSFDKWCELFGIEG